MSLKPSIQERIARARTDLRLGLPVVLVTDTSSALVLAADGVDPERLSDVMRHGASVLAITARRAETLSARAYDGDLARIRLPDDATAAWVASVADPQDDLSSPMKGALHFGTGRLGPHSRDRSPIGQVRKTSPRGHSDWPRRCATRGTDGAGHERP